MHGRLRQGAGRGDRPCAARACDERQRRRRGQGRRHAIPRSRPIPASINTAPAAAIGLLQSCLSGARPVEEVIAALEGSGLRGLGGAGFPTGRKWRLCAPGAGPAPLCGQCRRGRARHFQGPLFSRNRPAPLSRRDADRRLGGRGGGRLHLSARRIPAMPRDPRPEIAAVEAAGLAPHAKIHLRRGAGAYICGEELAMLEIDRRQARAAAPQAAVSVAGRPVRPPDPDQQCRDALLGARHRRAGAGMVHRPGPQRAPGTAHLLGFRPGEEPRRQARAGRHHRARS